MFIFYIFLFKSTHGEKEPRTKFKRDSHISTKTGLQSWSIVCYSLTYYKQSRNENHSRKKFTSPQIEEHSLQKIKI